MLVIILHGSLLLPRFPSQFSLTACPLSARRLSAPLLGVRRKAIRPKAFRVRRVWDISIKLCPPHQAIVKNFIVAPLRVLAAARQRAHG